MIDPRLRYLIAIGREGSFSSAAKVLGVTQSAVTKYVAELEKQAGYALFHRGRHGAIATDLGGNFLERIMRLLEDAEDILGPRTGASDPFCQHTEDRHLSGYVGVASCRAFTGLAREASLSSG
jgi:DNA-binding transcriptional LysR family regulator